MRLLLAKIIRLFLSLKKTYSFSVFKNTSAQTDKNPSVQNYDYEYYKKLECKDYPEALKNWYLMSTGETLNLENPQTFNEKIQWSKLYDSTELKTTLADKYSVREWVKKEIGEEYLIPILGVWDKFDDIDFDKLPDKFVLKTNHGSGWNMIVKDKTKFNKEEAKEKFDYWMTLNYAFYGGFELHYKNISPKIIAEKYLENKDGKPLLNYELWCFNNEVKYIQVLDMTDNVLKTAMYNLKWEKQDFLPRPNLESLDVEKPNFLDLLIDLANKMSKDFAHVRIDFYCVDKSILKFGEMTFTSGSGLSKWTPSKYNLVLGRMFKLPVQDGLSEQSSAIPIFHPGPRPESILPHI